MDRILPSLGAGCSTGLLLLVAMVSGQSASGLFSPEQAKQGESLFHDKCGACHGSNLDGGDEAPPLKGDAFWSEWDQQTARALYSRIISTMPPDSPGTLAEKDVIDIVALIAHENGIPQGTKAIEHANDLNAIKLQRPK